MKNIANMPTKADVHAVDSGSCETRSCSSWTDDLPACALSAVGFCASQTSVDTTKNSEQTCQDCWFRFRPESDTWVYGLLGALGGMQASDFARERLPAELLLGQLEGAMGDDQVREVLRQGFLLVDRAFLQSIDNLLLNRATLQLQLQNVSAYELLTRQPMLADELSRVNRQISAGCSASLAVLRQGRLFVAHVGLGRVLLVREGDGGTLSVEQLSVEHNVANEDELLRLVRLGLSPEALRAQPLPLTRCLGGYLLKAGHKESPLLREAREEPVLAEPEICGGIPVDDSCLYLLMLSEGLCQALGDAGMQDPNQEIARMVDQEVSTQSSLARAALTVVNRVAVLQATSGRQRSQGGLTLLVRPLRPQPERSEPVPDVDDPSGVNADTPVSTLGSLEGAGSTKALFRQGQKAPPPLDDEGRLEPYVDFGPFFALAHEALQQGTWPAHLQL